MEIRRNKKMRLSKDQSPKNTSHKLPRSSSCMSDGDVNRWTDFSRFFHLPTSIVFLDSNFHVGIGTSMLEGRDGSAWCVAGPGAGRGGGGVDVIKYRVWERKPTSRAL